MATTAAHPSYPPSPPPSRGSRHPPPLRLHTTSSMGSGSGQMSPVRRAQNGPISPDGASSHFPPAGPLAQPVPSRARPGGLAGIAAGAGDQGPASRRIQSPPSVRAMQHKASYEGFSRSRRGSQESSVHPGPIRRGSSTSAALASPSRGPTGEMGRGTPPPLPIRSPPTGAAMSTYSGRDGSIYGSRRGDGVSSPKPADLQLFAYRCKQFYFSPDPPADASSYISSTLSNLPPSHRASFTRLQSSIRSQAHLHHLRLRLTSYHALIVSTLPNASLTPLARSELSGSRAVKERRDKLARWLTTWCTRSAGGLEPFFRGLWAVLRAQSLNHESRGGAGRRRVVWEVDDAIFMEAGGADFMHEGVTILKGVLGFTDQPLKPPPRIKRPRASTSNSLDPLLRPPSLPYSSQPHIRTNSLPTTPRGGSPAKRDESTYPPPLPSRGERSPPGPHRPSVQSRSRAISDPFIDPSGNPSPDQRQARGGRRGPAPQPPPSRGHQYSPQPLPAGTLPHPLQSSSELTLPQTPTWQHSGSSSSQASPLLPGPSQDSMEIVTALEDVAERQDTLASLKRRDRPSDSRPGLRERWSDDEELLLGRSGAHMVRSRSNGTNVSGGPYDPESAILDEDDFEDEFMADDDIAAAEADLNEPRLRLWTFPSHIHNDEIESLLHLFPGFVGRSIGKARPARFPLPRPGRKNDPEAGKVGWQTIRIDNPKTGETQVAHVPPTLGEEDEGVVRFGHGRMWVGHEVRSSGWDGSGWFRFKRWFRRLFGGL